jgi:hypothetical protein
MEHYEGATATESDGRRADLVGRRIVFERAVEPAEIASRVTGVVRANLSA